MAYIALPVIAELENQILGHTGQLAQGIQDCTLGLTDRSNPHPIVVSNMMQDVQQKAYIDLKPVPIFFKAEVPGNDINPVVPSKKGNSLPNKLTMGFVTFNIQRLPHSSFDQFQSEVPRITTDIRNSCIIKGKSTQHKMQTLFFPSRPHIT